jgi:hypothetical protein
LKGVEGRKIGEDVGDGRFIGREMEGPREALGYLSKLEDMRSILDDKIHLRHCSVSCNGPETSPGARREVS